MTYQPKVYRRQGADAQVIGEGGMLVVKSGGMIVGDSESQTSGIAIVSTATIAWTTGEKAALNSVIAALVNVGILAATG